MKNENGFSGNNLLAECKVPLSTFNRVLKSVFIVCSYMLKWINKTSNMNLHAIDINGHNIIIDGVSVAKPSKGIFSRRRLILVLMSTITLGSSQLALAKAPSMELWHNLPAASWSGGTTVQSSNSLYAEDESIPAQVTIGIGNPTPLLSEGETHTARLKSLCLVFSVQGSAPHCASRDAVAVVRNPSPGPCHSIPSCV